MRCNYGRGKRFSSLVRYGTGIYTARYRWTSVWFSEIWFSRTAKLVNYSRNIICETLNRLIVKINNLYTIIFKPPESILQTSNHTIAVSVRTKYSDVTLSKHTIVHVSIPVLISAERMLKWCRDRYEPIAKFDKHIFFNRRNYKIMFP